jgi:hypothetical protein
VDIEEADVTWYFNDIEIIKGYPDWFDHIRMEDDGRERRLVITDCPLAAGGQFTAKTNQDETECILRVVPENKFLKVGLSDIFVCEVHFQSTILCKLNTGIL